MIRIWGNTVLHRMSWLVGAGFGSGLAPIAPGTTASLLAVAIYYLLPFPGDSVEFYVLVGAGFIVGINATKRLVSSTDGDPHWVVWDEFVGMWATCILLPKTIPWLAAAFLSFRVLDIVKPGPIRWFERLPHGWGIMADDLVAGLVGAVFLNALRIALFS
jgi:phosphatidylglycerophosphatase A